jgi:hypothetical protein
MMDKIGKAFDALSLLGRIAGHILDAVRRGEPERVDAILPEHDRARLHLLDLEERARRDLGE